MRFRWVTMIKLLCCFFFVFFWAYASACVLRDEGILFLFFLNKYRKEVIPSSKLLLNLSI